MDMCERMYARMYCFETS